MRRALFACITATLLTGTIAGAVGARPNTTTRTVEGAYLSPAAGAAPREGTAAYYYDCLNGIGCALLDLGPRDRFADLEVVDTAGQPVYAIVYRVPGFERIGTFCGSTDEAWSTANVDELLVHVVSGVCPEDGAPSVVTTGVVRATLSPRR